MKHFHWIIIKSTLLFIQLLLHRFFFEEIHRLPQQFTRLSIILLTIIVELGVSFLIRKLIPSLKIIIDLYCTYRLKVCMDYFFGWFGSFSYCLTLLLFEVWSLVFIIWKLFRWLFTIVLIWLLINLYDILIIHTSRFSRWVMLGIWFLYLFCLQFFSTILKLSVWVLSRWKLVLENWRIRILTLLFLLDYCFIISIRR